MSTTAARVLGVVLVALGILALVYGGFSYAEEKHDAQIGNLEFQVSEENRVQVPKWLGVTSIVAGVLVLLAGGRR